MAPTLYDKYGGFAEINRIVMRFYDLLLDNDDLGPYFEDVDIPRLVDHQTKFVAWILGGPITQDEDVLERAHARLGITDGEMDEMKRVLGVVLAEHDFDAADIQAVLDEIERHRPAIVKRTG